MNYFDIKGKKAIVTGAAQGLGLGMAEGPVYTASKGAIAQLTKALENDWAAKGINVNAIAPGYMNTDINEKIINNATLYEEISDRIPMCRWGTPEDMKEAVIFLASKASDYLSGAVIPVDGGYLCR
jgi:2-deoxy-D-gluconate 3-dehydrogenase